MLHILPIFEPSDLALYFSVTLRIDEFRKDLGVTIATYYRYKDSRKHYSLEEFKH